MSQPSSIGTKTCNVCLLTLELTCFSRNSARHDGLQQRCKGCDRAYYRERYAADPNKSKDRTLRSKYGIDLTAYQNLYDSQGGACAICGKALEKPKDIHVDHCHATGKVRGLLCFNCNTGLGQFKDNTDYLRYAIAYLEK